jgi:hypothetical protein
MTELSALERLTGRYGQDWAYGVLVDHLGQVQAAGLAVRQTTSGRLWVYDPRTSEAARPVLCAEIVPVATEDGTISGRCGNPVVGDEGACPGHAAVIASWREQTEAETITWEREVCSW